MNSSRRAIVMAAVLSVWAGCSGGSGVGAGGSGVGGSGAGGFGTGGGAGTSAGGAGGQLPPEHYCATTVDAQVAVICAPGTPFFSRQKRACSHYTIVVMRLPNPSPGAGCFYETATSTLVAYESCGDTGACFHVGPPLDDGCTVDIASGVDACPP
ncbi:MAG TPA: hypothetical protein VHU40_15960 [Polyangia bacterium]|nr:hypothetical protein [Polyangia bacterium]